MTKIESTLGNGPIFTWVQDYLTYRLQFVRIHHQSSTLSCVTSGVPQECVLALVLFLIVINDLPSNLGVKIRLFGDDCIPYQEINSFEDHITLNEVLGSVFKYVLTGK